jgi:F0F1-type ATP synthase membrane subunit b/b'
MKRFISHTGILVKSLMLIAVLAVAGVARAAEVTVTINNNEPIYIPDDQTVVAVPVYVETENPIGVSQVNILLPDELEFAQAATWPKDRFDYESGQDVTWTENTIIAPGVYGARFFTAIWGEGYGTLKNSGEYFTFYIKAKEGQAATSKTVQISFISPMFGGINRVDGELPFYTIDCPETLDVNLGYHALTTMTASESQFMINPLGTHTITLALESNFAQGAYQFDVFVPEGFSVSDFKNTSRVGNALLQKKLNNNTRGEFTRVVVFAKGEAFDGTEGDVITFNVTAPENFTGDATIKFEEIVVTNPEGTISAEAKNFTIAVKSGADAYNNALAEVKKLQDALTAALATIASDYPDYVAEFTGADIQTSIDNLKAAIDAAYDNMTLADTYDTVLAPVPDIQAAIDALIPAVQAKKAADEAENARKTANDEAYNKDAQAIADIEKALQDAIEQIKKDYPDGEDADAEKAVQDAIDAAKKAIEDAKNAVEKEGTYTSPINTEDLTSKVNKLVDDAKAAQAAADAEKARKAANDEAYNKDAQTLADIEKALQDAIEQIKKDYPDGEDADAEKAVQDAIDAAKKAIEDAKNAVEKEGTYTSPINTEDLTSKVNKLVEDAKAAQAAADAEKNREAANKKAYQEDLDSIASLQNLLDSILLDIKADYKDYEDVRAEDAAQKALDAAKKAVEDSIAAVEKEGTYTSPLKYDDLKAQIEKLLSDAKDAKAKADAEAKRQADNKAAYEADLQKIADLEKALNSTIVDIQADYKDFEDVRAEQTVKDAIEAAKKAVEDAYKAVAESGNYAGTVDVEGLTAQINKLLSDAQAAKEAARKAANDAAYQDDINKLKDIEDYLNDALKDIDENYPTGKNEEENQKVKDALDAAKKAVEDAKKAVEDEGTYKSPLDADSLKKMIDELVNNAKTNGIGSIYVDADGNEPAIYTIDGIRHAEPVQGTLNIMVYPDGTAKKVFVK